MNLYSEKKVPRRVLPTSNWIQGIADYNKTGGSYLWARGIDYRTEPSQATLLPQAISEGQGIFKDLGKWSEQVVGRTITLGATNVPITNNGFETSQNNVLVFRGYSSSGLEFAPSFVGTVGTNYFTSAQTTYNYFAGKGFSTVRLPFIWERAQPTLLGALDPTYMAIIDGEIAKANAAGLRVILDMHNYGRRYVTLDGGITENFTASTPFLSYPYADYSQGGNIVLRQYGEAIFGSANNPVPPATGYKVTFNMKFNSKDDSFGGEGLYVRPMWIDDNNCYEFGCDLADNTWILTKKIRGSVTTLATGVKTWGTTNTYAISIDINQASNGFINVSIGGVPLFPVNSVATDTQLPKGAVAFFPAGVHVQLDTLVLNVNGSTTGGGLQQFIIGSATVPYTDLADAWGKIATRYAGNGTVLGYDIMNEAHDMLVPTTSANYKTTASVTVMDQAAINAIRAVDGQHYILAEIDQWAGAQNFTANYGSNPDPWLTDPAGKLVYSFHYYMDNDHSGSYQQAFATSNNTAISGDVTPIMSWGQSHGVPIHCGEFGVPNITAWQVCLTTFLDLANTYNVWTNHWAAGDQYTAVTTLQPTGSVGSFVDVMQMAIVGSQTYLVPVSSTGAGWTLGSDYIFFNGNAYRGNWSIKQTSVGGTNALTTASGSGLTVTPFADYQLVFYSKVSVTSGQPSAIQVLGGALTGPNLLSAPQVIPDTGGVWMQTIVTFNAGQYSSVFLKIANQNGNVVASYDYFTMQQINSIATYTLGNQGNLYKRYSNGAYVNLGTMPNNHGNGLAYYGEDDYLYVIGDKTVGRYGPISSGTPKLVFDYLGSAGGIPTNTNSALLTGTNYFIKTSPSSDLKVTGDLSLEAFIKPTALPIAGNVATIMGMWDENANKRAYVLQLSGISGFFGSGVDGSLTISTNQTQAPIDSACSGVAGFNILNANNASFAVGQKILIIQMQGTGYGTKQIATIQGYNATTNVITTVETLNFSYNSSSGNAAQVIVLPQYTNVTVNTGITWSVKPWNGVTGGVLSFLFNGTFLVNGTTTGTGAGFRGGIGLTAQHGTQGEGYLGLGIISNQPNGNGGGADIDYENDAAAGGGNGTPGGNGQTRPGKGNQAIGGLTSGSSDLTTITLGGGGGAGGYGGGHGGGGINGAPGGGIIMPIGVQVTIGPAGLIVSNGANGSVIFEGASAPGAGGSILLLCQTATLGVNQVVAVGGLSVTGGGTPTVTSGSGGDGRIHVGYLVSFSGSTAPTLTTLQDNSLVTTTTIQLRLGISNDGTSFEYYTQNLQNIMLSQWDRLAVSWNSASSIASFYENANPIGISTGTKTAIYGASTAAMAVGANVIAGGAYGNPFSGEVNDVRTWNTQRTGAQFIANNLVNLQGSQPGLVGEWFLSNTGNDLTSHANNLIATGSPAPGYVTDVPFAGATTRGDLDQSGGGTGQTYSLPIVLTEADKMSFVPLYDPQKSLQVFFGTKGTGDVTLVVHDGLNQIAEQMTVTNANLPSTGAYEFVYPQTFSPVVGATYHFHLYSTVNDATVVTSAASDPTTIEYKTYYQFLVTDTDYHPAMQMGNMMAIGNGRYLAVVSAAGGDGIGVYNSQGFNSRRLVLPAGWRIRSFAQWLGYYAIGCWKGTGIKDFEQGIVFLWDGNSVTYNDYFFVPEGGVNAMYGENDILYIIAGYRGDLLEYTGASKHNLKVKRIPRVGNAQYLEVEPGSITFYDGLLRIGVAYNSDSTTLERGVYTWGTRNVAYPRSLSYDYPISTGNRFNTVQIGALIPVNGSLLMHYQDGVTFGVGNINPANPPQTTGTLEQLMADYGFVWHEKNLQTVRADHLPLPTGAFVDVKYKLNYEDNWHNLGTAGQDAGDQVTRLPISTDPAIGPSNYHALQIAFDLYANAGQSPVVLEHGDLTDLNLTQSDENENY